MSSSTSKPVRVLIVDDDSLNAKLLKTLIHKAGNYDIKLVSGGPEALFYYIQDEMDIIFLDIVMPLIDGETVLRTLNELCEKGLIPLRKNIVVCTSLDSLEQLERITSYPQVSGLLRKPVGLTPLIMQVQNALGRQTNPL